MRIEKCPIGDISHPAATPTTSLQPASVARLLLIGLIF